MSSCRVEGDGPSDETAGGRLRDPVERLEELFDHGYDRLVRFCAVRVGSIEVAEDIAAAVFSDAARTVAGERSFDIDVSWLYMVARRRMIDHWRSAERRRKLIRRHVQWRGAASETDDASAGDPTPTAPESTVVEDGIESDLAAPESTVVEDGIESDLAALESTVVEDGIESDLAARESTVVEDGIESDLAALESTVVEDGTEGGIAVPESTVVEDGTASDADDAAAAEAAAEIGTLFMEARADHDAEAIMALLAPDATFSPEEFAQSVEDYPLVLEWERLMGWQFLNPSCSAGSPDRVVCTYAAQDLFNAREGKGPFVGNSFLLQIADGRIQVVNHNLNATDFFVEYESQFFSWARENRPADFEVMVEGDRLLGGAYPSFPRFTTASIQLWEENINAYLATQE